MLLATQTWEGRSESRGMGKHPWTLWGQVGVLAMFWGQLRDRRLVRGVQHLYRVLSEWPKGLALGQQEEPSVCRGLRLACWYMRALPASTATESSKIDASSPAPAPFSEPAAQSGKLVQDHRFVGGPRGSSLRSSSPTPPWTLGVNSKADLENCHWLHFFSIQLS